MVNFTIEQPPVEGSASQRGAYEAGEVAYQSGRISLEAWHLYERLVFRAGTRGYCWYKVQTLAEEFRRCVRQVGRWLKELVDAALVTRKRRGNGPAITEITACVAQASFLDDGMSDPDLTPMSDRSIKDQPESGGGSDAPAAVAVPEPESPVAAALKAAGVISEQAIRDLSALPMAYVNRLIAYARHRPGLIVWLGRRRADVPEEAPHERVSVPGRVDRRHDRPAGANSTFERHAVTIVGLPSAADG